MKKGFLIAPMVLVAHLVAHSGYAQVSNANQATIGSRTFASTTFTRQLQLGGSGDALCPSGTVVDGSSGAASQSCASGSVGAGYRGPVFFGNEGSLNGGYDGTGAVQTADYIAVQVRHGLKTYDRHAVGVSTSLIWAPTTTSAGQRTTLAGKYMSVYDTLGVVSLSDTEAVEEIDGITSTIWVLGSAAETVTSGVKDFKAASSALFNGVNVPALYGFYAQNKGLAGVVNSYVLYGEDQTGSTNNWFLYSAGGKSYHAGNFTVGAKFGYSTGVSAGGTVTQLTSKATGATLSKATGQVTTHNAALAANTTVSFILTNTTISATDVVLLNHVSGGTAGAYTLNAQAGSGTATINVRNVTAGSLSEAIVISFAVVSGATN